MAAKFQESRLCGLYVDVWLAQRPFPPNEILTLPLLSLAEVGEMALSTAL